MFVEQTKEYQRRMEYHPETHQFTETEWDSLAFVRNVTYPYGWLKGFGTPPERHLDILLISNLDYALGETVPVKIVGVFIRNDGDHKLVAVLPQRPEEGEGWFGLDRAEEVIRSYSDNSA